jgi:hypothetical protein
VHAYRRVATSGHYDPGKVAARSDYRNQDPSWHESRLLAPCNASSGFRDGPSRNTVTDIGERSGYAPVVRSRFSSAHAYHQSLALYGRAGPPRSALGRSVVFLNDQFRVPSQKVPGGTAAATSVRSFLPNPLALAAKRLCRSSLSRSLLSPSCSIDSLRADSQRRVDLFVVAIPRNSLVGEEKALGRARARRGLISARHKKFAGRLAVIRFPGCEIAGGSAEALQSLIVHILKPLSMHLPYQRRTATYLCWTTNSPVTPRSSSRSTAASCLGLASRS